MLDDTGVRLACDGEGDNSHIGIFLLIEAVFVLRDRRPSTLVAVHPELRQLSDFGAYRRSAIRVVLRHIRRQVQSVGMRRFSSSNQFWTKTAWSDPTASTGLIMRKREPSAETS